MSHKKKQIKKSWIKLYKQEKDQLIFVTIIVMAMNVAINDNVENIKIAVLDEFMKFKKHWSDFVRRKLPGLVWRGFLEFDLCRGNDIGPQKTELFKYFGIHNARYILVPHIHAIFIRGNYSIEEINNKIKSEFHGKWRVLIKKLHEE